MANQNEGSTKEKHKESKTNEKPNKTKEKSPAHERKNKVLVLLLVLGLTLGLGLEPGLGPGLALGHCPRLVLAMGPLLVLVGAVGWRMGGGCKVLDGCWGGVGWVLAPLPSIILFLHCVGRSVKRNPLGHSSFSTRSGEV